MSKVKIGLLPLYVKIYDTYNPERRRYIEQFYADAKANLEAKGAEVVGAPVCRLEHEFLEAVNKFENEKVDALVTLHLAYSPSLQSERVLAETKLPLIIMDTTPDYSFFPKTVGDRYMTAYNHGIHGVQDMCTLLRKNGKDFQIFAGHMDHSDVVERVVAAAVGAKLANALRCAKVGTIGGIYDGMGDFRVPYGIMEKQIGAKAYIFDTVEAKKAFYEVTEEEVDAICRENEEMFSIVSGSEETLRGDARFAAVVRKWIEKEGLTAFTQNFLTSFKDTGFPYAPFIEACKAMARGLGYAGEGDVLTAALVGALMSVYKDTAFVEMFCPDWEGNAIYLSHLGELNPNLTVSPARICLKALPYPNVNEYVGVAGTYRDGRGVYVSLAPTGEGKYTLVLSEVDMFRHPEYNDDQCFVAGWFRPSCSVASFLEQFSIAGGTHHGAFAYGADIRALESFGKIMGFEVVTIK